MEELKKQILDSRRKDPRLEQRLCRQLRTRIKMKELQEKDQDRYAQCFADTYLCESFLFLGNIKEAVKIGLKTIKMEQKEHFDDLAMVLSNLLGYCFIIMDDYENSSQWYIRSIELARKNRDRNMMVILHFNIGENYYLLEQYARTRECLKTGMEFVKENIENPETLKQVTEQFYIQMAFCDLKEQQDEKAAEWIAKVENPEDFMEIFLIHAMLHIRKEEYTQAENSLKALLAEDMTNRNPYDLCMAYFEAYEQTLLMKHETLSKSFLTSIFQYAKVFDLPNIYYRYYDEAIKGCMEYGWADQMEEMYEKYYFWNQQVYEKRCERILSGMQNQMKLFSIKNKEESLIQRVKRLEKVSIKDELTKAYSRTTYESFMAEALESMKQEKRNFGFALIQIDEFQKFNEEIGAEQANKCLQTVAKAIRDAFLDRGRVYRITGSEFIVISKAVPTLAYVQSLQKLCRDKKISSIRIDSAGNKLALSIGAINCRPNEESHTFDYEMEGEKLLLLARKELQSSFQFADRFEND